MKRTAGEKEQDRHGGYLPIVSAAIKHKETGWITPGKNHQACQVIAYRIATGDTRTAKKRCPLQAHETARSWFCDQPFEEGFVNSIGMFFNWATATQIVCKLSGRDTVVQQLSCKEILAVGLGIYKSGGALPCDNKIEKVDVEDEW